MKYVDLHVHTTYSDGAFTPGEAVAYAKKAGLAAIGITDHDITDGIDEAISEGMKNDIEIVPGIEISAGLGKHQEKEIHILGYYINWKDPQFQELLSSLRRDRLTRAHLITEKLYSLGVRLKTDEIFKSSSKGSIGRLHFAKALINQGFVNNLGEAFSKYLADNKPAYVQKTLLPPAEVIAMLKKIGGIAVLAHPVIGNLYRDAVLSELVTDGLDGIEVWHSKHSPVMIQNLSDIANKMGLLPVGGSDCHGVTIEGTPLMGTAKVAYKALEGIKKHLKIK